MLPGLSLSLCKSVENKQMDQNQTYDQQTIEVMLRVISSDSNCIDVGCHSGVMLDEILKLSPRGFHYAFEPLPQLYSELVKKFGASKNITICNAALSEAAGSVTFQHVVSNPGYSGLKQRRYDRPNEVIQEITVEAKRLDDIVPASTHIAFMKIDVEGAELQVFRGAIQTIKRCRPVIVFEHGLGAADYYGTTPEAIYDLLANECGMRCFVMETWLASDGKDCLSRSAFCDEFRSGRNYYFLAAG
jgi:FkbM family methyltransferase